jgi:CRISPR-associated protein Cas2
MNSFGGFRSMWILAMFDLPTDTKKAKQAYREFRKLLKLSGFTMLQYSVYARPCASEENANVQHKRIKAGVPADGEVRVILFTDKQFERMHIYHGKLRKATEKTPGQISFF